jgi:NitT/TauT family transport system substrate-binding protein
MGRIANGRRGWRSVALGGLLGLVLVAGGLLTGALAQAPATIKYGAPTSTPDITTVGVYFALENGYFKRDGLDVQVTRYPGSPTAVRALLSGEADVVETGGDTALLAMESGAKIDILLSPVARGTDVVVARAPIASIADLKGKSFAVSAPGSPGDVLGRLLLQKNGVDPGTVQFVGLGSPTDRIKALLAGKVDSTSATILVIEPVLDAIAKGEVKVLTNLGDYFPAIPLSYIVGQESVIKSRHDAMVRFVRGYIEGLRWAQANPDEAARIGAKYIRETPINVLTSGMREMSRLKVYGVDGGISDKGLQETQQQLKDLGRIKTVAKSTDIAALDVLQDALKLLGK